MYTLTSDLEIEGLSMTGPMFGEIYLSLWNRTPNQPIVWQGYKIGMFHNISDRNSLLKAMRNHSFIMGTEFLKDWISSHKK